jgi:antitoxin component YwqK of YwqJK toxin-antitoxin module
MNRRRLERCTYWTPICLVAVGLFTASVAWAAKPPQVRDFAAELEPITPLEEAELFNPRERIEISATPGQVEVVRERYADGKVKIERQVTLDAEGNYVNHGVWKMFNTSEHVIAEGHYDMGQRVGTWTRWFNRGDAPILGQNPFNRFKPPFVSVATFSDDQLDGEWSIIDADQRKCVQMSLSGGRRHGPVITWLPNGKVFQQAAYNESVPVGDFFEANKKGELDLQATYVDGRRLVTMTTHYDQGRQKQKKTEELYLAATTVEKTPDDFWNLRFAEYATEGEGMRHGPSKAWYQNGAQQHEGFYELGKKSGTFTFWHPNGQVSATGEYQDDVPGGLWVWWHETGQKAAIGKYQGGVLIGKWRWWNEAGRLAKATVYDGSERVATDPGEVLELARIPQDADAPTIRR